MHASVLEQPEEFKPCSQEQHLLRLSSPASQRPAAADGDNSLFTGLYVGGSAAYEDLDVKVDSFGINFATFSNRDMSYGGLVGWRSALSNRCAKASPWLT